MYSNSEMIDKNKGVDKIIRKYLNGDLGDEECKTLIQWLDEDKENVKYLRDYSREWNPPGNESLENSWNILLPSPCCCRPACRHRSLLASAPRLPHR